MVVVVVVVAAAAGGATELLVGRSIGCCLTGVEGAGTGTGTGVGVVGRLVV